VETTAHRRPNLRGTRLFVPALVLLGAGCASFASPGPVGPMRPGNATQLSAAWTYAYGPATATVNGTTVTGNGQTQTGEPIPIVVPATVGFRQSIGGNAEISADVGVVDSGIRLRVGLPSTSSVPFDVALEGRSGWIALPPNASYHGSVAVELYPDITPPNSFPHRHLILSAGLASGVFEHALTLPFQFSPDAVLSGPTMTLLRPEVRLETAVGVYLGGGERSDGTSIVVAPWFLLRSGAPTSATCPICESPLGANLTVSSYSQTWGVSLIVTPSYGWLHLP
jgi:hypothetical protein